MGLLGRLPPSGPYSNSLTGPVLPRREPHLPADRGVPDALTALFEQIDNPPTVRVYVGNYFFQFLVYPIWHRPRFQNAVYIFGQDRRYMHYIGRAEDTFVRISPTHHKLKAAKAAGANELWVHAPGPHARFDFEQSEQLLIQHHFSSLLNEVGYGG